MAAAANRASTAIEFIVKPKDDLFLEGTLRTLPRVTKGSYLDILSGSNRNALSDSLTSTLFYKFL